MFVDLDLAATFLAGLSGGDGWTVPATFQTLDDQRRGRAQLIRCLHSSLRVGARTLTTLNADGAGIFVTVNATNARGRKASDIIGVRALFIDEDAPSNRPLALPPSMVVRSARGRHVYWLLKRGEPLEAFTAAQRQLAKFYGSDATVCDLPRVMRLPGFSHQKATSVMVTLDELHADRRYTIADILAAHPVRMPRRRVRPTVDLALLDDAGKLDALSTYVGWAMARSRAQGTRNTTAFQIAAEGYRRGMPEHLITQMVLDYCAQAGIPNEAASVLRSALTYHQKRT